MTLTPVEKGSSKFAAFETALAVARLPVNDLDADGAQYFAFGHREDEPLAFVGMITFGKDGLLRSLVVPEAQRGQSHGCEIASNRDPSQDLRMSLISRANSPLRWGRGWTRHAIP